MSFLTRIFSKPEKRSFPLTPLEQSFLESLVNSCDALPNITPRSTMQITAAYACVRILGNLGTLPCHVYRRDKSGNKDRVIDTPQDRIVRVETNQFQTPDLFFQLLIITAALHGNAIAQVLRNEMGHPLKLIPIPTERVTPRITPENELIYEIKGDNGLSTYLPRRDILHLRWVSSSAFWAYNPIELIRTAAEGAKSAENHGINVFRRGGALKGTLEYPTALDDPEYERIKKTWKDQTEGAGNAWATPILENGLKFTPLGMPNSDAQFIETRRFQNEEIARFYGVPKYKLQDTEKENYSNSMAGDQAFYKETARPWFTHIQTELNRVLFIRPDEKDLFAEFLPNDLVRADIKTRYETYGLAIQNGIMTPNEVRAKENMNALPGGDDLLIPLNMNPGGEDKEPESKEPEPEAPAEEPKKGDRALEIFRPLFTDAVKRLHALEANAIRGKKDKPGFIKWAESFYNKHPERAKAALQEPARALKRALSESSDGSEIDNTIEEIAERGASLSFKGLFALIDVAHAKKTSDISAEGLEAMARGDYLKQGIDKRLEELESPEAAAAAADQIITNILSGVQNETGNENIPNEA